MPFNPYRKLTSADIEDLLKLGGRESALLEYKRELPEPGDKGNREFAADICALANGEGGCIIFGVAEEVVEKRKTGKPGEVVGVDHAAIDEARLRLANALAERVKPRIPGVDLYSIEFFKKTLLVAQVPRSWAGPHLRSDGDGTFKAVRRNDSGKIGMDWNELRTAFSLRDSAADKIAQVRKERDQLAQGGSFLNMGGQRPALVVHVIPFSSVGLRDFYDLRQYQNPNSLLVPIGGHCNLVRPNFDGVFAGAGPVGSPESMVQLYRVGQVAAVTLRPFRVEHHLYRGGYAEDGTISAVGSYLRLLKELGAAPPVFVALTIVNAIGINQTEHGDSDHGTKLGFSRNNCDYPPVIFESFDTSPDVALRPIFDCIWQTLGFAGCPYYDASGKRVKQQ